MSDVHDVAKDAVKEILNLYNCFGSADYVGEAVSQLAHALQAAKCAVDAGCSDAVVIASLLHDAGHLLGLKDPELYERMGAFGVVKHEIVGKHYCDSLGLPGCVGILVASHVDAKRYLAWKNPGYHKKLSEASTATLQFQGGPMESEEAARFEASPFFKAALKMRTFDEAAKVVDMVVPSLESYAGKIRALIDSFKVGVDVPVIA